MRLTRISVRSTFGVMIILLNCWNMAEIFSRFSGEWGIDQTELHTYSVYGRRNTVSALGESQVVDAGYI